MSSKISNEFGSPIGRLVQGSFSLQQQKDDNGNLKVDKDGKPEMAVYFAMAFAKTQPDWPQFEATIKATAAQCWPQFFPQGPMGPCLYPNFSMKIIDGDGMDQKGQPNASKPGFAGHWIVKFKTSYVPKVHIEGKFQPHEVLADPDAVFKRGFYGRVIGQIQSNMAQGTQKAGVAIYPNIVIFTQQGEEIVSGINVADAAAKYAAPAYVPAGATAAPLAHPGAVVLPATTGAAVAPTVQPVIAPVVQPVIAPVVQPVVAPIAPVKIEPQLTPGMIAANPGVTYAILHAQGHTDETMRANGWII